MPAPYHRYNIFPLGDAALTIEFGHELDEDVNKKVIALFENLSEASLPHVLDIVPAYTSITIHYDAAEYYRQRNEEMNAFETVHTLVQPFLSETVLNHENPPRRIDIPVCYHPAVAPDMEQVALLKNITTRELIRLHTGTTYRIYMMGFLPGFPYMGKVHDQLVMERKAIPVQVQSGAVGIAGLQTGIYPMNAPGGWHIIGRTPMKIFDARAKEPVMLRAGDEIQFYSIDRHEFENY